MSPLYPGTRGRIKRNCALTVFALPFAIIGMVMLCLRVAPILHDWWQMRSWQPAEARIETSSLRRMGRSQLVEVRYRYAFGAQEFTGTRVALVPDADKLGDFHPKLAAMLESARREQRPVQIWVDPRRPAEAVLDRSLRPGLFSLYLLFALVFGGIGFGMLYAIWRAPGNRGGLAAAAPLHRGTAVPADGALDGRARREEIPGGIRLVVPYFHGFGAHAMTLIWGAGAIGLSRVLGGIADPAAKVAAIIFGVLGGAFLLSTFWVVLSRREIELDRQHGLRIERRLLGIVVARKKVPAHEIRGLSFDSGSCHDQGAASASHGCSVKASLGDERSVTLIDAIDQPGSAERLAREIGARTGWAVQRG